MALLSAARAQLAPGGVLRAGINLSNFLLVSGPHTPQPVGVSPDMAAAIADRLGVGLELIPFKGPAEVCAAAEQAAWDIGLVGADPLRMDFIDFTPAYSEIHCCYMVPRDSTAQCPADLDAPGTRIAVKAGAAYHLWLRRHLEHAEMCEADTLDASYELFDAERLEGLAGLKSKLAEDMAKAPGRYRVIDQPFMAVQQAVGCLKRPDGGQEAIEFLRAFVEEAKASGLVERLISKHGVAGRLQVAASEPAAAEAP